MSYSRLKSFIEKLKKRNGRFREIQCPSGIPDLLQDLAFQIDRDKNPNILLKEETAVELGPPDRASFQTIFLVKKPDAVPDGLITIIGPDLPDAAGQSLPFGQVFLIGGEALVDAQIGKLERKQSISSRLPGYMVRLAAGRIWARVSKEALGKGFSFETLGRNLMAYYKQSFPEIESMGILFLTSSDEEVMDLRRLLVNKNITAAPPEKKAKKIFGCTYEIDCQDCPNKPICDRIREMAVQFENRKPISQEERRLLVREILK
ncbi:MAG: hypothetical protein AB1585_22225 [Thermodesulfobacteriota bacterium]